MQYSMWRASAPFSALATGPSPDSGKNLYRRWILFVALAALCGHAGVLAFAGRSWDSSLLSNLAQVLLGALAVAAMLEAGRRSSRFPRRIWFRGALAVSIYSMGQAILTYGLAMRFNTGQYVTNTFFFFWMVPLLAAAVADRAEIPDGFDWASVLDFAQLVALAIALHMFVFGDTARWHTHAEQMAFLKWKVRLLRDAVVLACLFGRAYVSGSRQTRGLFFRLGTFYLAYSMADAVYLYRDAIQHVRPGTTWFDLLWSVPRVLAVLLALNWNEIKDESPEIAAPAWLYRCMFQYWAPVIVPLIVLSLGAWNLSSSRGWGWAVMIVASFAIASTRLLLTRIRQEQALAELDAGKSMLHSVIEGISDVIYLKDAEGRYQLINSAGATFLGLRPEQVIGKSDSDLLPPEAVKSISRSDQEMHRSGLPVTVEEILNCGGRTRTFLCTKNPYRDPMGGLGGVLGVAVDVTERRAMEEQLRRAQRMESLGTFSGGIAHDFNNLLTVIKGYSQLALTELGDEAQTRGHIEQVEKAAARASSLISQLLAFSRQQVLQLRVISLNQVLSQLQKMLPRLIGEDIEMEIRLAADLGAVKADPSQVEQILMNLAANARDAMPSGGRLTMQTSNIHLKASLPESSFMVPPGEYVLLEVRDTGMGMDAKTQARIFEPFFTTKSSGKGTGLGLATVYGIVKQSGGHIAVASSPGNGTTFKIYLPRVHEAVESVIHNAPEQMPRSSGQTVMVVDDDEQVRQLASAILSRAGFIVLQAGGAGEAERVAAGHRGTIHLLLADVVMPGGGGREAARRLRALHKETRVLFMSGHANDALERHGVFQGQNAFVAKPFSPGHLVQRVNHELAVGPAEALISGL